jgi:hypothetical protein
MKKLSNKFTRNFEIDWKLFPTVVFESDDWGACEVVPDSDKAKRIVSLFDKHKKFAYGGTSTLEAPEDLEALYRVLENAKGPDGMSAVFTGFVCTSNPDYDAMRKNGFSSYEYIGLDKGVPPSWNRGDVAAKLREGCSSGVFAPEYHGMLHHTSIKRWLERLNSDSSDGELARELFDMECYYQGEHVPEYDGLDVREQYSYTRKGVEIFKNIFGFEPDAAVTSDAYPETETVWSINGIKTVCLKNCRLDDGHIEIYRTKPWNNQDASVKIGAYNPIKDVVYMTRNVFFEINDNPEKVFRLIKECISRYNEPAMVSSHRNKYVNIVPENVQKGLAELSLLLSWLVKDNFYFLSTAEVSQLYRQGWSKRYCPQKGWIVRKWHENAENALLPDGHEIKLLEVGTCIINPLLDCKEDKQEHARTAS